MAGLEATGGYLAKRSHLRLSGQRPVEQLTRVGFRLVLGRSAESSKTEMSNLADNEDCPSRLLKSVGAQHKCLHETVTVT